ncbi:MAG: hypothetical protein QM632_00975 [Micrococcaceae bacterium]
MQNKEISRRQITKGASWGVPVIATAIATPALAASFVDPDYVSVGLYRSNSSDPQANFAKGRWVSNQRIGSFHPGQTYYISLFAEMEDESVVPNVPITCSGTAVGSTGMNILSSYPNTDSDGQMVSLFTIPTDATIGGYSLTVCGGTKCQSWTLTTGDSLPVTAA